MRNLRAPYFFIKLLQHGTFTGAARALNIPLSTLSREIAALERELKHPLLYRSTRQLRATDAGQKYFERWREIVEQIDFAHASLEETLNQEPAGSLRITTPPGIGDSLGSSLVKTFLPRYPKIKLDLLATERMVDLIQEGFDAAIRAGRLPSSSYRVRKLGETSFQLYASASYFAGKELPRKVAQLSAYPAVVFPPSAPDDAWTLVSKNKTARVRIDPIIKINSFEVTRDATIAGYGIGLLPTYIGEPLVTKGSLALVLPGWGTVATPINLVMPAHSERSPKVSAFVDFVLENRKEVLGL
jgi:DNA-binding transcriptional LysR family regulator